MQINRRSMLAFGALLPALVVAGNMGRAQTQPSFYQNGGIAIDGTDPVAYFKERKPVAGDPVHAYDWMGVTWQFSSAANREAFIADPTTFAPQFGGYCAWAVSEGYTASTTPKAWKIVDDKLYLNYSKRIQRRWERDVPGHIDRGNANWPSVLG
jgi:YHS domain-containing protein